MNGLENNLNDNEEKYYCYFLRCNRMNKLEMEFTDDQLAKVKQLEGQGFGVGDAIDMLFELQDNALSEIENIDEEQIDVLKKPL
jgi:hypothetical protein